jgi:tryptophan synthase alpha chain
VAERIGTMLAGRGSRPLVIPYLTAGFPDASETVELLLALERGGADAIELGLPFSDPLADGPVIQSASQVALRAGMTHRRALDLAAAFRARSALPLLLMGYVNPILAYGPDRFFADAAAAGVDGLILPDLPPEEAGPYHAAAVGRGLDWVFLAAPTSSDERLRQVDRLSTRLNYCVAVAGVTGERSDLAAGLSAYLARAAGVMRKPFVVGFGISRAEQVRLVVPPAAGVVVGSGLLRALGEESDAGARRRRAEATVRGLRP